MAFVTDLLGPEMQLVLSVSTAFGLALSICFVLAAWRKFQTWHRDLIAKRSAWAETAALDFILSKRGYLPPNLPHNPGFRDFLVRVSARFTGELGLRLLVIYCALGYARDDIHELQTGSLVIANRAMKRARSLSMPLTDAVWERLLKSKSRTLRWAAMDHYIAMHGKKASLRLVDFLSEPDNQRRGMAIHLLSEIGNRSPQALLSMVEHSTSEFLINMCLDPLSSYPTPGSELTLINLAKSRYGSKTFPLALKAVAALPSQISLDFLLTLAGDPSWEIREQVALSLGNFGGPAGIETLERLCEDISYPVRQQAVASLLVVGDGGGTMLQRILTDPHHPAIGIVRDVMVTQVKVCAI